MVVLLYNHTCIGPSKVKCADAGDVSDADVVILVLLVPSPHVPTCQCSTTNVLARLVGRQQALDANHKINVGVSVQILSMCGGPGVVIFVA